MIRPVAIAVAVAAAATAWPAPRAARPDARAVAAARRVVAQPLLPGPGLSVARARTLAGRRASALPLPAGGTFTGIRWSRAPRPITPGLVEQIVEYNARCQWQRAAAEHRDGATAAAVLAVTAGWPGLRGIPAPDVLQCYASHDREVAFARAHGRVAST